VLFIRLPRKARIIKYLSLLSAIVLTVSLCAFGTLSEDSFKLSLSTANYASAGTTLNLTIKIASLPKDVYAFECELTYDTQILTAVNIKSTDDFLTVNKCAWEQHCSHTTAGRYYLAFCTDNADGVETPIKSVSDIEISIPFKVKSDGECTFKVVSLTAFDKDLNEIACTDTELTITTLERPCSFATAVTCISAVKGNTADVEITLTNISQTSDVAAIELRFLYSAATVKATVTSNASGQMDAFITKAPAGWTQMCSHDTGGRYTLRLVAPSGGADVRDCLQLGESIKLTLSFAVIGEIGSTADFDIPEAFCTGYDSDFAVLSGTGSACSTTIKDGNIISSKDETVVCDGKYIVGIPVGTKVEGIGAYIDGEIKVFADGKEAKSSSLIGTGMTARLYVGGKSVSELAIVIRGDVDGNGEIGISDAVRIRRIYLGLETADELTTLAACISGGTKVAALDYLAVKRHLQGTYNIQ